MTARIDLDGKLGCEIASISIGGDIVGITLYDFRNGTDNEMEEGVAHTFAWNVESIVRFHNTLRQAIQLLRCYCLLINKTKLEED